MIAKSKGTDPSRRRSALACAAAGFLGGAAAAGGAPAAVCRAGSFGLEVAAGQEFSRDLGGGLELRLLPQHFADPRAPQRPLDGWQLVVAPPPAGAGARLQDRIWPVNPPLRFNPQQDIGTTYGIAAAEKLRHDIAYRFVWKSPDYDTIAKLAADALWPYSAPDPEHAGARYLGALARLQTAELRLHPVDYELSENGLAIRRLKLKITVTAPRNFALAHALAPTPATCPLPP